MLEVQTVRVELLDAGSCNHYAGFMSLLDDIQGEDDRLAEGLKSQVSGQKLPYKMKNLRISRVRTVVNRLSAPSLNVTRYTFAAGCDTTMLPVPPMGSSNSTSPRFEALLLVLDEEDDQEDDMASADLKVFCCVVYRPQCR